jgi:hypothetical protein
MGVTVAHPSYALRLLDQLDALRDERGRPYRYTHCMASPYAYDEDTEASVKENAARICCGVRRQGIPPCPALAACREQRDRMIAAGEHPRGVWGGEVMPKQTPAAQLTRKRNSRNHKSLPPLPPDRIPIVV